MHHRELINPSALHPAPGFSHIAIASRTKVFAAQVGLLIETECTAVAAG